MKYTLINTSTTYVLQLQAADYTIIGTALPGQQITVEGPASYTARSLWHEDLSEDSSTPGDASTTVWFVGASGGLYDYGVAYTGVAATFDVPVIGEVAIPAGTSPEAASFLFGFCLMAGVRIMRAALRWFKRAGYDQGTGND